MGNKIVQVELTARTEKDFCEAVTVENERLADLVDKLEAINTELVSALQALVDGRPTQEPPAIAKIAHRNWELFQQARLALDKTSKLTELEPIINQEAIAASKISIN